MYTHVEVEPNANCPMAANQVFKNLSEPVTVAMVRLFEGEPDGRLFFVTGWSSKALGTPCPAYAVNVEDSSAGSAFLIYGGDWGIRLRPEASDGWQLNNPGQWGETHLVLADRQDIIDADA